MTQMMMFVEKLVTEEDDPSIQKIMALRDKQFY